jgi:formylglycine-generating enzyme required for sulfatase activity
VSNPSGPATGTYRVLRGGSWSDDEFGVRVALRNWLDPRDTSYYVTGFRCSRSLFEDERPVTTQPAPLTGSSWIRPADEMTMHLVPAGEYDMGSEYGELTEQPVHTVFIDAFYMDEHEVTNAMYALCEESGACEAPSEGPFSEEQFADHPVVYVTWQKASDYCEWAEARLPTEAEWEKAARGGLEGASYPWGDEAPTCTAGAVNGAQSDACDGDTIPVKSFSPNGYGLYDMAGNAWEMVSDWADGKYYANSPVANPFGPESGILRILRGGSWDASIRDVSVYHRGTMDAEDAYFSFGFRCSRFP